MNYSTWLGWVTEPAREIPAFWYVISYLLFLIFFNSFQATEDIYKSAKKAGYISFGVSLCLWALQLIPPHIPISFLGLIIFAILGKKKFGG